jgi:transglutaminase-like putative cysteine protease
VRYHIHHETEYAYEHAVSVSRQALHLAPRPLPWQRCLSYELHVDPQPTFRHDENDCFGNPVTRLEIDTPHRQLAVVAEMDVEVGARREPALDESPAWEDVAARFIYVAGLIPAAGELESAAYRAESPLVRLGDDLAHYARASFLPRTPLLRASADLMARIHRDFRYDTGATHVATPLAEVFEMRHGVCQDFAHVMVGCLRALGLPARYISGYLRTEPPPGQPRLIGADASHAWVAVHCPRHGWVDFDPTNAVRPDLDHITLAWGRDFGDVSPMRGIILGGGRQQLTVRVTVTPVDGQAAPVVQPFGG